MAQNVERGEFKAFNASAYRLAIVAAEFNRDITESLLESALSACALYQLDPTKIPVLRVPGSIEIPVVLKTLAENKSFDCLVAIGAVIRGETPHFDYVAKIVSEGILRVMMDYRIPVGFGVLTCNTHAQALARSKAGADAVIAALHTAKNIKALW